MFNQKIFILALFDLLPPSLKHTISTWLTFSPPLNLKIGNFPTKFVKILPRQQKLLYLREMPQFFPLGSYSENSITSF